MREKRNEENPDIMHAQGIQDWHVMLSSGPQGTCVIVVRLGEEKRQLGSSIR